MAQKNIIIISGEASGDLNAATIAKEILKLNCDIKIYAVGGELLRTAGAQILYDIKELSVMGLFDVLKKLPKFFALKKFLLEKIKEIKPRALIFVDFSGFNLRLAKELNNTIPTIYYISPQVWASRQGRIKTLRKYISKIIVLFKFEEEFYKRQGITVDFTGHPLLDIVKPTMDKKELLSSLGFAESKTTIALLPGSRKQEIIKILPVMLKTARLIGQEIDAQFVIAKSPNVSWDVYNRIIEKGDSALFQKGRCPLFNRHCEEGEAPPSLRGASAASDEAISIKVVEGKTYDCLNISSFALVASGTATLEAAIMQKPFVIIYKMGLLNYLLYRPQVKIPYIGMVNIIAKRRIIPEFIQLKASPGRISQEALRLLKNQSELEEMKGNLLKVKSSLGETGAGLRAAQIIINFLKNNN